MNDIIQIIQAPAILPVVLVLALLILERMWQIPERLQPLLFLRLLGVRMADKVNADAQADLAANINATKSAKQNTVLAGILALLLLTIPWLIILFFMNQFAYYPLFFDAFLLFISLQFSHHIKRYHRIQRALALNKKNLAKDMLRSMVLRDTHLLSSIGISKAAGEGLQLRFFYQQITVVFWFVLAGPFIALFYRMVLELLFTWNPKRPAFAQFGLGAKLVCHWMQWVPVRLGALCAILATRGFYGLFSTKFRALPAIIFGQNGTILLAAQSRATRLHFSGAVMYQGCKI